MVAFGALFSVLLHAMVVRSGQEFFRKNPEPVSQQRGYSSLFHFIVGSISQLPSLALRSRPIRTTLSVG